MLKYSQLLPPVSIIKTYYLNFESLVNIRKGPSCPDKTFELNRLIFYTGKIYFVRTNGPLPILS